MELEGSAWQARWVARRVGTLAGLLWCAVAIVSPLPVGVFVLLWLAWTVTRPLPGHRRGRGSWLLVGSFLPAGVLGPTVVYGLLGSTTGWDRATACAAVAIALFGLGRWVRGLCADERTRNRWTGMAALTTLAFLVEGALYAYNGDPMRDLAPYPQHLAMMALAARVALLGLFLHMARLPAADPGWDWPLPVLSALARLGLQQVGDEVVGVVRGQPVRLVRELQGAPGFVRVEAPLLRRTGLVLRPGQGSTTGDPVLDGALVASGPQAAELVTDLHEPLLAVLHGFPRSEVDRGCVHTRVPVELSEDAFDVPDLLAGVKAAAELARVLDVRASELELELPARPEAERLVFGSWKLAGFEDAWELWGDREVTRLIGGPWERDEVRARVATEMLSEREHGVQYWPISTRRGAFVGACGLTVNDHGEHELGFHLCHRAWGQGFAREAAQAVIVFAFGTLGLMRLVAGHHPDNAASARMLEKLEFRYVGDRFYAPTGLHHPHYERVRRGVAVER